MPPLRKIMFTGTPFYSGQYDKAIERGHQFIIVRDRDRRTVLAQSIKYPNMLVELTTDEYRSIQP